MVRHTFPAVLAALALVAGGASASAQSPGTAEHPAASSSPARQHASDELASWIDARFYELWKQAGVEQKELVDDATFLRRVYLDLVGTIPSVAQARDFLEDPRTDKRQKLIEQLIDRPRSSAHLSRVFRRIMVPNGSPGMQFVGQFEPWLQQQFAARTPYDKLARELITATGNAAFPALGGNRMARTGSPVNFYMAVGNTPDAMASSVTRVFLGVRIGCAKCHNHPFAEWRQEDFWGMAAFFAGANLTGQPNAAVSDKRVTTIKPMDSEKEYTVRFLWSDAPAALPEKKLPREMLADWLVSKENPNFAATAVNRVWQQLCGQGLVPHVDDLDQATPKQRAAALDDLAGQFIAADYDLQWLFEGICKSRVYQRLSATNDKAAEESPLSIHRPLKTLSPEQVFDALEQALMLPVGSRDQQSARFNGQRDALIARLNEASSEAPDQFRAGIPQALMLMNGLLVSAGTDLDDSRTLRAVVEMPRTEAAEKIATLYLAALTRQPEPNELERMLAHVQSRPDKEEQRKAYVDIYWALLNSPEFVLSR